MLGARGDEHNELALVIRQPTGGMCAEVIGSWGVDVQLKRPPALRTTPADCALPLLENEHDYTWVNNTPQRPLKAKNTINTRMSSATVLRCHEPFSS